MIDLAFKRGWLSRGNSSSNPVIDPNKPFRKPRDRTGENGLKFGDGNPRWSEKDFIKPRPRIKRFGSTRIVNGLPNWLKIQMDKRKEKSGGV